MDTPSLIRVVIADDHRMFLDGLQRLLEGQPEVCIVALVESGGLAIEAVEQEQPDILLLDIDMPDMNAFAVANRLKRLGESAPRIILLTMHNELPYIIAASRPDIHGFVLKDAAFDELIEAIHKVHGGERYMGHGVSEGGGSKAPLTAREMDVLRCAAHGMTAAETSDDLKISVKTVETHRSHILRKLKVPNITTAVHLMHQQGIQ